MAEAQPRKKSFLGMILVVLLVLALGGASGFLYYKYDQSQKELDKLKDPKYLSTLQEQQVETTLSNLGKIILLPEGQPTVATIIDVEALKKDNEAFYKNAQNGDKLVVFKEQAIIYREEENKVINVAPVFVEPETKDEITDTKDTTDTTDTDTTDDEEE